MASSPIAIALRAVSTKYILTIGPLFGWLLRPPIQQKPSKSEVWSLSLFLFFPPLNLSPKPTSKCNPPRVPLARNSSPMPPPPPTLSFGWLLRFPVKWRPFKTGAQPISLFYVAPYIAPKQQERVHPTHSTSSDIAPPRLSRPSVYCCVHRQNGSHLRSRPCPSLNISMGALLVPKSRGRRAVRPSRAPKRLHRTHGVWRRDSRWRRRWRRWQ